MMTTLQDLTLAENFVNLSFFSGVKDMDGQTSDNWDIIRVSGFRAPSIRDWVLLPSGTYAFMIPEQLLASGGSDVGLVTCLLATRFRAISLYESGNVIESPDSSDCPSVMVGKQVGVPAADDCVIVCGPGSSQQTAADASDEHQTSYPSDSRLDLILRAIGKSLGCAEITT